MVYNTAAYYRTWAPYDLFKAARIQTYTAVFPEGFTRGDDIDGELIRRDTRTSLSRNLAQYYPQMGFKLLFKWQVAEGSDLPPCAAFIGGGALSGAREHHWWQY
jgi:hypothetical protein